MALYRLLGEWPADRLVVVHSAKRREKGPALEGVRHFPIPVRRLLERGRQTRWHAYANMLATWMPPSATVVDRALGPLRPDAVLTVAHDFLWLSAAEWCLRTNTPLHIIIHDDWPEFLSVPTWARRGLHRRFGKALRQAATRLCVSPGMAREYRCRYGVDCDVLLPSRGTESPKPELRCKKKPSSRLITGYLGGLPLAGYSRAIRKFADLLHGMDAEIYLYGSHSQESLRQEGLIHPAIVSKADVPHDESFTHMVDHVSALFCPVSFQPEDATIMRTLFPSKLADYTACGIPIVIWGPEESSAVQWARAHDHAAFVCTAPEGDGLIDFLHRLRSDEQLATRYSQGALAAGESDFSIDSARAKLVRAMTAAAGAGSAKHSFDTRS